MAVSINFNPLAPCGARHKAGRQFLCYGSHFNPLAPCGARQLPPVSLQAWFDISIHLLHAEQDQENELGQIEQIQFQSTCSMRSKTKNETELRNKRNVFQSTCSMRSKTRAGRRAGRKQILISIHLLHAEQDTKRSAHSLT